MDRSLWAILAGMLTYVALLFVSDMVIEGAFPDWLVREGGAQSSMGLMAQWALQNAAFSLVAGRVTGWLAERNRVAHSMVMGLVLVAMCGPSQAEFWYELPLWFHWIFLGGIVPMAALGGRLAVR